MRAQACAQVAAGTVVIWRRRRGRPTHDRRRRARAVPRGRPHLVRGTEGVRSSSPSRRIRRDEHRRLPGEHRVFVILLRTSIIEHAACADSRQRSSRSASTVVRGVFQIGDHESRIALSDLAVDRRVLVRLLRSSEGEVGDADLRGGPPDANGPNRCCWSAGTVSSGRSVSGGRGASGAGRSP